MDKKLLEILVCPKCKGKLEYEKKTSELICKKDALAFPVRDGIPVMLENEARQLSATAE
ncbi:MAG: Trm112 family protein [Gammaproteobacteria bacterium]|nr:Trm112 family protein [Gammaproteobacteria bacterium]